MKRKNLWIAAVVLAVVALLAWRWVGRTPSNAADSQVAEAAATTIQVAVAKVERRQLGNTLTIAGEFKPFQDVEVHAKVAGYIRKINVDVGDHVKDSTDAEYQYRLTQIVLAFTMSAPK